MEPGDLVLAPKLRCIGKIDGIGYVSSVGYCAGVDFGKGFFVPRITSHRLTTLVDLKNACHQYANAYLKGIRNLRYDF